LDKNIFVICNNSSLYKIEKALDNGIGINSDTISNDSFIKTLEVWDNKKIIKKMIKSDIDINYENVNGLTPLLSAIVYNGNIDTIKLLIDNGARINVDPEKKYIPLFVTITSNNPFKYTKLLIENGANVNIKDKHGMTPLMNAAEECDDDNVISLLLRNGAEVNEVDNDGKPALIYGIYNDNIEITKKLLSNGALDEKDEKFILSVWEYILKGKENNKISAEHFKALIDIGLKPKLEQKIRQKPTK